MHNYFVYWSRNSSSWAEYKGGCPGRKCLPCAQTWRPNSKMKLYIQHTHDPYYTVAQRVNYVTYLHHMVVTAAAISKLLGSWTSSFTQHGHTTWPQSHNCKMKQYSDTAGVWICKYVHVGESWVQTNSSTSFCFTAESVHPREPAN